MWVKVRLGLTPPSNLSGVTVSGDVSSITGVTVNSGSYTAGNNLDITVVFSEVVLVTQFPRIALNIGGNSKYANYLSGTNSATLIFRYTIEGTGVDGDGIGMTSPLELNGGAIKNAATSDASLRFSLPANIGSVTVDREWDLSLGFCVKFPAVGNLQASQLCSSRGWRGPVLGKGN